MASRVTLSLNFQKSGIMSCREDYKEVRVNSNCLLPVRAVGIGTCSLMGTTDMYKEQFWTRKLEMESWLVFLISCLPHNQWQEQHPSGVSLKPSVSLPSYYDPQIVLTCHGQRSLLCRVISYFSKTAQVNCNPPGMNLESSPSSPQSLCKSS